MCQCSDAERRHRLEELFVDIAPAPVLTGLEAADYRVARSVEVRRRMAMRRIVAAPNMAASETKPEMNPLVAHLQTFLAARRGSRLFPADVIEMLALILCHHGVPGR
jgi:hypothetical protein